MGEDRRDAPSAPPGRKLTVFEVAGEFGISAEAVRTRLKRGTPRSVKEGGAVYVLLEAGRARPDTDQTTPGRDRTDDRARSDAGALISAKDETIAALRDQLQAERQA